MSELKSFPIPSLIQGISQQAEVSRGTASAEDQWNCLNDVLDGVVSRMGSVVLASHLAQYSDPFCHLIEREEDEAYLVVIEGTSLRVFNVVSGVECSVSGDIAAYLSHTGISRKAFSAVTVEDTTFLANRRRTTAMSSVKTPARANEAIAYFKAGHYSTTYTLTLIIPGYGTFTSSYETPDNSVPENAQFIDTTALAEQFRQSFNTTIKPDLDAAGYTGFSIERSGSTLKISAPATTNYQVDTSDGQGDRQFVSFHDKVRTFTDLPARCFSGYKVAVAGSTTGMEDDYYLQFVGNPSSGVWEEITKPDTPDTIDPATMPHVLVNVGVNQFTVAPATWGKRLAGDGVDTSKDPNFIGKPIIDLQFIYGRLAVETLGQVMLSKAANAYVFFPDTAQTKLDSDPIGYNISNGSVTILKRSVVAGGKLQLWAGNSQMTVDSGQEALREDTTDIRPMSNYRYDGEVSPQALGLSSVVFGSGLGRWNRLMEVFFRAGQADGQIEITAHCPRLIEGRLRHVGAAEDAAKVVVLATEHPTRAYLYEWFNNGQDRVQSAWNKWSMPACQKIIWADVIGDKMYVLLRWDTRCTIEVVTLDGEGDELSQELPLRLDHRISETGHTRDGEGYYVLDLPYEVASDRRDDFQCVERLNVADFSQRGRPRQFEWVSPSQVRVLDNRDGLAFHFGRVPVARRKLSKFHLQDDKGPVLPDRLQIANIKVGHNKTVEYDVEVTRHGGELVTQYYRSRVLGDPSVTNAQVKRATDSFTASIGEESQSVDIELVNRSVFPCAWTSMEYAVNFAKRSQR